MDEQTKHFTAHHDQTLTGTIAGAVKAVRTVIFVPDHDSSIYTEVAHQLAQSSKVMQPPILQQQKAVQTLCARPANRPLPTLRGKELLGLFGILMQFTSYLPRLRPFALTPFMQTEELYQAIIVKGRHRPLSFSDQLEIALGQTDGDLPEALWRLWITSRLYARWFDTSVIIGLPPFKRADIIKRMEAWSQSLAACKAPMTAPYQDVSGDIYYCWTHALACYAFGPLAPRYSLLARSFLLTTRYGTQLNHRVAHAITPQRLPSDHTIAAAYGNALGKTLCSSDRHML